MMEMKPDRELKAMASSTNVAALAKQVLALQTADKFRLASYLLDLNKIDLAEAVGMRACQEIQLAKLFGNTK